MYRLRTQTRKIESSVAVFFTSAVALAIDQASKWFLVTSLGSSTLEVTSFLNLHIFRNQGIAFGISIPAAVYAVLLAAVFVFLGILYSWLRKMSLGAALALGFVLGGGMSNLIDRVVHGAVTDWIEILGRSTFNIADICITFGIIILLFLLLGEKEK